MKMEKRRDFSRFHKVEFSNRRFFLNVFKFPARSLKSLKITNLIHNTSTKRRRITKRAPGFPFCCLSSFMRRPATIFHCCSSFSRHRQQEPGHTMEQTSVVRGGRINGIIKGGRSLVAKTMTPLLCM